MKIIINKNESYDINFPDEVNVMELSAISDRLNSIIKIVGKEIFSDDGVKVKKSNAPLTPRGAQITRAMIKPLYDDINLAKDFIRVFYNSRPEEAKVKAVNDFIAQKVNPNNVTYKGYDGIYMAIRNLCKFHNMKDFMKQARGEALNARN